MRQHVDPVDEAPVATVPAPTAPAAAMGAVPLAHGGVAFTVWAPHADAVAVVGDFNDWARDRHPLARVEGDCWTAVVPEARPGQQYRFELRSGDSWLSRIDPYAREVTNSAGNGVVHDPLFDWEDDRPVVRPWHEMVIYELHIGTFGRAADQEGPATFEQAIAGLDHLVRLGVNAVQVMPIAEFAGALSWGYNPACVFAVEQSYGGARGFKSFVREAHRRGLSVILDVVYNHFGPDDLHLWRFDGWSENDLGGIYFYNDHRADTPWGQTRPDYGRPEVRHFIRDNALMWLEEYRVDGLRFDMTLYVRTTGGEGTEELPDGWSLMQWVNDEVQRVRPGALTIAEDLQNNDWLTRPVADGGAGFGAQWDARFVHPVREVVIAHADELRSMDAVRHAIDLAGGADAFRRIVYSESHDEVANGKARVPHEIGGDDPDHWWAQKRSTLAAALVFTAPGIPMLFQGQEFLQGGWFRDDRGLDWHRADEYRGIVRLYRDLVALRRNLGGTTRGLLGHGVHVFHVDDAQNIIAFHRWDQHGEHDDVVVVVNLSYRAQEGYTIGFPEAGTWIVRLDTDSKIYSKDFGGLGPAAVDAVESAAGTMPASGQLSVPAYSALVLSKS